MLGSDKIAIRIFSLSTIDGFEKGNLPYAIYWLMQKGKKPYQFREKTPVDFPAGSIALFSFGGQIFGHAITSEEIKKYSSKEKKQEEPYEADVRFEPSSIDIFSKYPTTEEVEKIRGKSHAHNFDILNWQQYQEILRLAGRKP